jgi:hypothetical protein
MITLEKVISELKSESIDEVICAGTYQVNYYYYDPNYGEWFLSTITYDDQDTCDPSDDVSYEASTTEANFSADAPPGSDMCSYGYWDDGSGG